MEKLVEQRLTIFIVNDPCFYPPTLNAITYLSIHFKEIHLISFSISDNWTFPDNVHKTSIGSLQGKLKVLNYLKAVFQLAKSSRRSDATILYDGIALFLYRISRVLFKLRKVVWYHNHDVFESDKKLGFIAKNAKKTESDSLNFVSLFTLPTEERLPFFDLSDKKVTTHIVPNYPDLKSWPKPIENKTIGDSIDIVYQGKISDSHGFHELLKFMQNEPRVTLTLVGFISEDFRTELIKIAEQLKVQNRFNIVAVMAYSQLKSYTKRFHIGWAVNVPQRIIYQTGGKASNKIYEYMASGLPVIYYDYPSYNKELSTASWTFKTDLSQNSLSDCIHRVQNNYQTAVEGTQIDFADTYNFEKEFNVALRKFSVLISEQHN